METPKFTVSEETFNKMVTKLSDKISILEYVVSYAMCIDTDLEWKFKENWRKHPEIIEDFDRLVEKGES